MKQRYYNKNIKNVWRGFTLIELLVVIAIIGILASVVLASVNIARDKGTNATIRSNLNNTRSQATIYYDEAGNVYEVDDATNSACINSKSDPIKGVADIFTSADSANGAGLADCNDDPGNWAIAAQLVGVDSDKYYCSDSSGFAGDVTGVIGGVGATDFQADDLTCN